MIPISSVLLRLGQALLLGGLVGLEREHRERPAGLRTHMLVTLASAAFMVISVDFTNYQPGVSARPADPARIASYVVAGMGFLGAGTIIRSGHSVKGLTTASTLWLVSAVGLACGAGMFALAWITAAAGLVTLLALRAVEHALDHTRQHPYRRRFQVTLLEPSRRFEVLAALAESGVVVEREEVVLHPGTGPLTLHIRARLGREDQVEIAIDRISKVASLDRLAVLYSRRGSH